MATYPLKYTGQEIDARLAAVENKADIGHTHSEYLTEHQDLSEYAKKSDIPTEVGQLANDKNYATETFVTSKIAEAQLEGEEIDLSGYATKDYVNEAIEGIEIPEGTERISGTVTTAVGGITKNTEYTNATIAEVLSDLLFPYVAPYLSSISTSEYMGILEYGTKVKVTKVTPTFTKGSKNITSIKIGTTNGGSDLYSGTSATSGTAITLTTPKTYDGTTGGTIYCVISDGQQTSSKSASVTYSYVEYSKLTTSSTPDTSGATRQNISSNGHTYSYSAGQYLWLYSRDSGKIIEQNVSGTWAPVNTYSAGSLTLTLQSGATATYYAYTTDQFTANGSATYRLA